MCLIIASKHGVLPSEELLKIAHYDNSHGWGVMWAENGRVHSVKGFKYKTLLRKVKAREGSPFVVHLRWATSGNIDQANSHPFRVSDDLWLMHNGVFHNVLEWRKDRSDTWHFAQELKGILQRFPKLNKREHHNVLLAYITSRCGWYNKVALMRGDGTILIANEAAGTWKEGDIWLSNTNSEPGERAWLEYFYDVDFPTTGGATKHLGPVAVERAYTTFTDYPEFDTALVDDATFTDKYNCPAVADGELIEFKTPERCDWCCYEEDALMGFEGQLLCLHCFKFAETDLNGGRRTPSAFIDGALDDLEFEDDLRYLEVPFAVI